jgi:hypothetical protein
MVRHNQGAIRRRRAALPTQQARFVHYTRRRRRAGILYPKHPLIPSPNPVLAFKPEPVPVQAGTHAGWLRFERALLIIAILSQIIFAACENKNLPITRSAAACIHRAPAASGESHAAVHCARHDHLFPFKVETICTAGPPISALLPWRNTYRRIVRARVALLGAFRCAGDGWYYLWLSRTPSVAPSLCRQDDEVHIAAAVIARVWFAGPARNSCSPSPPPSLGASNSALRASVYCFWNMRLLGRGAARIPHRHRRRPG